MTEKKHATASDKEAFHDGVSALMGGTIPRDERILASAALIDAYVDGIGDVPDAYELERLADALLYEELSDMSRTKSADAEYPFMSERQFERRYAAEAPLECADTIGTDGSNYRVPKRRERHHAELILVDKHAKIRNKARANQYRIDSAAGPVITVDPDNLTESYVIARGLGVRWREQLMPRYITE